MWSKFFRSGSAGGDGVIIWFQWLIAFGVVVAGYVACAAHVPDAGGKHRVMVLQVES